MSEISSKHFFHISNENVNKIERFRLTHTGQCDSGEVAIVRIQLFILEIRMMLNKKSS